MLRLTKEMNVRKNGLLCLKIQPFPKVSQDFYKISVCNIFTFSEKFLNFVV